MKLPHRGVYENVMIQYLIVIMLVNNIYANRSFFTAYDDPT